MSDYFGSYFSDKGFDFHRLINDDLINPVRILFKAKHYVSAIKLLMVAIDSVGYIEFGEKEKNPFIAWLDRYSKLENLSINSIELWEQRNSLLDMSNLNSRKVQTRKVRKLIGYVGLIPEEVNLANAETGYYDIQKLIFEVGYSLNRWIATYDEKREKIDQFVGRYDLIASDVRMLHVN